MASNFQPVQAKTDFNIIKLQRDEKRRKQEIKMDTVKDKCSQQHIEAVFLYEKFKTGNCWKTRAQVNAGLRKITTKTGKIKMLKEMITIYVKGLQWKDLHTPWSQGRVDLSKDYLREHLLKILRDPRMMSDVTPILSLPKRKKLPVLGSLTADVKRKNVDDENEVKELTEVAKAKRIEMIDNGKRDEMRLIQPSISPTLKVGDVIQMLFFFKNNDTG